MVTRFGGGPTLTEGAAGPVSGWAPVAIQRGSGINVSEVSPLFDTELAFADLVHRGSAWTETASANGHPADVDANGYPAEAAYLFLGLGIQGRWLTGTYTLAWSGAATSLGSCMCIGTAVNSVATSVSLGGNSYTAAITLSASGSLVVQTTSAATAITLKGVSESGTYLADEFISTLARMNPKCIRTLDWQRTNWAETVSNRTWVVDWSLRTKLTDCCWGVSKGVPAELLIHAAETLSCDLWVCLPVHSSVSNGHEWYIRGLATTLKAGQTDSKIIVEFGNELWNSNIGPGYYIEHSRGDWSTGEWSALLAVQAFAWFKSAWIQAGGVSTDLIFAAMGQQDASGHGYATFLDTMTDTLVGLSWTPDMVGCAYYAKPRTTDIETWTNTSHVPTIAEYLASGIGNCSVQLRAHLQRAQWTQTSRGITYLGLYEGTSSNKSKKNQTWGTTAVASTLSAGAQTYIEVIAAECIAVDAEYFCWLGFRRQINWDLAIGNWGHAYDVNDTDTYRWLGVVGVNGGT